MIRFSTMAFSSVQANSLTTPKAAPPESGGELNTTTLNTLAAVKTLLLIQEVFHPAVLGGKGTEGAEPSANKYTLISVVWRPRQPRAHPHQPPSPPKNTAPQNTPPNPKPQPPIQSSLVLHVRQFLYHFCRLSKST